MYRCGKGNKHNRCAPDASMIHFLRMRSPGRWGGREDYSICLPELSHCAAVKLHLPLTEQSTGNYSQSRVHDKLRLSCKVIVTHVCKYMVVA